MNRTRSALVGVTLVLVFAGLGGPHVQAQATQPSPPAGGQAPATPPDTAPIMVTENIVVSASKTEQLIVDAPATMTVIGPRALEVAPSSDYSQVLRSVPGLNITQISARDVNVTSRGATGSLATSQLAVLDGRSLYQDFFGFTMWDFMPANLDEVKRIEVIRGPASAVWGANALNGVINILTKSPREMPGSSVTFGGGTFNRSVGGNGADSGSLFYVRGTHAAIANDRWSYKLSAGTYDSDAFARPVGNIPNGQPSPTPYPNYANQGTTQPKFDVRVDYDHPDGVQKLQFTAGVAGTDGVMHTGIGPFDIASGTRLGYWKANYSKQAFRLQVFMNVLDGDASNLISIGPDAKPIGLDFNTKTFDVEAGDTRLVAGRHALTYGGNLRLNRFNLTLAPGENSRTEGGAYLQDEILLSDRVRVILGGRVDKFSSIDGAVFSPRTALVFKPTPDQSVRVSYNRAFRAPSMINNNLDTTVATALPLGLLNPALAGQSFLVPSDVNGNPNLGEEHIDAFEVAYTGNIRNRASVSVAVYYTRFSDAIYFTQQSEWGITTPPPGWPLGPLAWAGVYQVVRFPRQYTYLNLGEVRSKGFEVGVDGSITNELGAFVNYSFQAQPDPEFPGLTPEQALREVNLPSKHLVNAGMSYVAPRVFGTLSVSSASEAFWQDVLDSRFHGTTEPYATLNATIGTRFVNGRYTLSLRMTNLANTEILQHVFGDVSKRLVAAEFRVNLPR
jgi:outer membrane receptor protein involved in Fe transport